MPALTQKNRLISVSTPLGEDNLILTAVDGSEELGKPFQYRLRMVSESLDIDPAKLLGQPVSAQLCLQGGKKRWIHGVVRRFSAKQIGADGHRAYEAVITPWLDLLRNNTDCRIFQNMSVPDILKQVFKEAGFTDFSIKSAAGGGDSHAPRGGLHGQYAPRDYCVQFNESDFNFVHRLMHEEGIFYYFQHQAHKHLLVLCDTTANYPPKARALEQYSGDLAAAYIRDWHRSSKVTAARSEQRAYNYQTSSKPLIGKAAGRVQDTGFKSFERYHYTDRFDKPREGQRQAHLDIETDQAEYDVYSASTNLYDLTSLSRFSFKRHSDPSEAGQEYIVIGTRVAFQDDSPRNGTSQPQGEIKLRCIRASVPYRLQGHYPRPSIQGIQTASVTGPSGKDIHCDEYGRICVLFHWDRKGRPEQQNTCWLRVAQDWAGQKFGAVFTPRIGQEVIISFIQGDPDRPVVTGSLYNDRHQHPYALPGEKTRSGIRTRSTPNGGADQFNELRFEDQKDKEEVYLQAQRDFNTWIKHNETNKVDQERQVKVGKNDSLEVGESRKVDVKKDDQLTSGNNTHIKAGKQLTLEAGSQITLKTGGATIVMKSDGSIQISGNDVKVNGSQVDVSGSMVSIKGSLLKLN